MRKTNLQIFVPVDLPCGLPAAPDALENAIATLCALGGGVTLTRAFGVWIDPRDGGTIREAVHIVETDAEGEPSVLRAELETLAHRVGRKLEQASVYIRTRETDATEIRPAWLTGEDDTDTLTLETAERNQARR